MHATATRTSAPTGQCHISSSKNIRNALQDRQNTNWWQQAYYHCTILAQQPNQDQQRKGALASKDQHLLNATQSSNCIVHVGHCRE
ncbi:hypothetical protein Nepgr_004035 [Nepenthes gracilis]|uniref:Uncharacterized protein n=1 Tax=Nepenthes gracilis TaxID=150966 RepID=A0AAD3S0T8_NEPGR|nr:hypothetical protein Nepgr_004035 [Nepenthes gracilis]